MIIDISTHAFLQEILDQGKAEGLAAGIAEGKAEAKLETLRTLLTFKFGHLPIWANQRLDKAHPEQLDRWLPKILTAGTLEATLGRRS